MSYRYQLIKGAKKWNCPSCNKKRFVRMEDTTTGEMLSDEFGRCDREDSCGYENMKPFIQPENYQNNFRPQTNNSKPDKQRVYIPEQLVKDSMTKYENNPLVSFLTIIAGKEKALEAAFSYKIGTSSKGVVFWYIDQLYRVHYGAVMGYEVKSSPQNHSGKDCKRIKGENTSAVKSLIDKITKQGDSLPDWLTLYEQNENKIGCPFGAHLLSKRPEKTVCMVEAPKTAIIASIYFPQFLWLAIGAKSWLKEKRCSMLKGRTVILWPDLGAFEDWTKAAAELSSIGKFKVNDLLEKAAEDLDRIQGLDLADYLLRNPLPENSETTTAPNHSPEAEPKTMKAEALTIETSVETFSRTKFMQKPEHDWTERITSLENYFSNTTIPTGPINLIPCATIENPSKFIDGHLALVKSRNGFITFLPYLERLEAFREMNSKPITT